MPKSVDNIFISGPCSNIEYAIKTDGSMPAKKQLEKLETKDYEKYSRLKVIMVQFSKGTRLPKSKLDSYSGNGKGLMKFKHSEAYPYRVICFTLKNNKILTNVFKKTGSKQISTQIKIAQKIKKEHEAYVKQNEVKK